MTDQEKDSPSALYLAYVYGGGVMVIGTLVYAGFRGWPFVATVLVGAMVQLGFRTLKRVLRGNTTEAQHNGAAALSRARAVPRMLVIAYLAMIAVCALWYGIGKLIRWV